MAAPMEENVSQKTDTAGSHISDNPEPRAKKQRLFGEDTDLPKFLSWCTDNKLVLSNKVRVGREGSCAQNGMVAVCDIQKGETLFTIPRDLLLTPENSRIADLLKKEQAATESRSGWVRLLIALMYEVSSPGSMWRPYIDIIPQVDLPLFWPKDEMERELSGTGVPEAVNRDVKSIQEEFSNIVLPFVKKHNTVFPLACQDLMFYKRMVAFVMAYSFTEPELDDDGDDDNEEGRNVTHNPPMMVPIADILNHTAKNNAHLNFGKDALKMVAICDIKKGEEVFNTYGHLANAPLLQMYGFAEEFPHNHNDTVDLPVSVIQDVFLEECGKENEQFLMEKWKYLMQQGLVSEGGSFVLGVEGILTEEEMHTTLKVLFMDQASFKEYTDNEGWLDAKEDEEDLLTNDAIKKLPLPFKEKLSLIALKCMEKYPYNLQEEEDIRKIASQKALTDHQKYSHYVRYGQLSLLQRLKASVAQD